MAKWKIAGINFDHFHMGDNLRFAHEHPDAQIVGLCDAHRDRMADAARAFGVPDDRLFTDHAECIERTKPDIVICCPATAEHGAWVERIAPFGVHVIVEKPFAATLAEADRMIAAMKPTGKQLGINWPLAWYPPHRTAKRLIDAGAIGGVIEVHYYDGNRGPLWHGAHKTDRTAEQVDAEKPTSWFYQRSHGGGSLQDYLGYGTTLGTWFMNGATPIEVTCVVDEPTGLEVDEHSITIARYAQGLSRFETRWGTFTDPWTHQPQPKCGFVIVGERGTIASYDYERAVRVQDAATPGGRDVPVDSVAMAESNPVAYLIDRLERGETLEGPMSVGVSRIGQQIVDASAKSAREKRTVRLA